MCTTRLQQEIPLAGLNRSKSSIGTDDKRLEIVKRRKKSTRRCQLTVISPLLVVHPEEVSCVPQTWPLVSRVWQMESGDCVTICWSAQVLNLGW